MKNVSKQDFDKGNVLSSKCPSREILNHVTSKWGVLILICLLKDKKLRFSELRNKIDGVSERMLGQTLKNLENDSLVNRYSHNVVPPVVEYSLTEHGIVVSRKVNNLVSWLESNLFELIDSQS